VKARHFLMAIALIATAWFSFFADKTPGSGIAEPAEHAGPQKKPQKEPQKELQKELQTSARGVPSAAPLTSQSAAPAVDASKSTADKGKSRPEPVILALRNRAELIGGASAANKGNGLFGSQSWTPPPAPPPPPSAPPPPTAPALPFTFLGKKLEDGNWEVYLGRGDNTLIVHEKTEIDATYRVESIKPPTITLTYLPLNQMQTMPIGGAE